MKNDLVELNESIITHASNMIKDFTQNQKIYCPQKNLSIQVCFNKQCSNNAFICDKEDCACQQNHQKCFTLNKKKFMKTINSKRISTQFLEKFIDTKTQELIDLISKFQDETKNWIKNELQFLGLNPNEKKLLCDINNGNLSTVSGNMIWSIINSQYKQSPINDFISQNLQILENQLKDTQKSLQNSLKKIKQQIETYQQKIFKSKDLILFHFILSKQKSKILTQTKESTTIKEFLDPKNLKSAKLLYRASENDFEVKKFHQKCDGVVNTLLLVETQFGKKIGGYTSIKWNSSGGYQKGDQMTSFVFSLTNCDKFPLTNKEYTVYHDLSYGPTFGGGHDLYITDKANVNNNSYANINHSYKNEKYQYNDKNSWERFQGNPTSHNFKVKQWEVWGLQFQ